jgi:uncharacterized protein YdbL (DUF1318 family)
MSQSTIIPGLTAIKLHTAQYSVLMLALSDADMQQERQTLSSCRVRGDRSDIITVPTSFAVSLLPVIEAYAAKIADETWQSSRIAEYLPGYAASVREETGADATDVMIATQRAEQYANYAAYSNYARITAIQLAAIAA